MQNVNQRVLVAIVMFFIVVLILILLTKIKTKETIRNEKLLNLSEKLKGKHLEAFENIQSYISNSLSITEDTKDDILNDILSILLDAQQRNEPPEKVIAENYKSFCDDIVKESKPKDNICILIMENLYPFLLFAAIYSIVGSIDIIEKFINKTSSSLDISIKMRLLFFSISILFISYLIIVIIRKKSFSDYKYIYIFFLPLVGIGFVLLPVYAFKTYMDIVLFKTPFYVPILLSWLLFLVATIFLKKNRKLNN